MQGLCLLPLVLFELLNLAIGDVGSSNAQNNGRRSFVQVNVLDEIESLRRQMNFETTMRMQYDKQLTTMAIRYRALLEEQLKIKEENEQFKAELLRVMDSQEPKDMGLDTCLQKFGSRVNLTLLESNPALRIDDALLADLQRNISSLERFVFEKYEEETLQDIVIEQVDTKLKKMEKEFRKMKTRIVRMTNDQNVFSSRAELRTLSNQIAALNESVSSFLYAETECLTEFEACGVRDCRDIKIARGSAALNGYYSIWPDSQTKKHVLCDMRDEGWTVFQRRQNGKVDFYRTWQDYKDGFGSPEDEYWLGNEYIHLLTVNRTCRLRIEMENWNNVKARAEYDDFGLDTEENAYKLTIGKYNGNAGRDSLGLSNGNSFSTWDRDYDDWEAGNCAMVRSGGWWYLNWWCSYSNLNGKYNKTRSGDGVWWYNYPAADNMKVSKMMLTCY